MKNLLSILILCCTISIFGQNTMTQNSDNPEMEEWAEELTNKYSQQLAMQEKQRLLFQNKLVEFKLKEEKIRSSEMSTKEKLAELQFNYQHETKDMADILTQPQLDVYRKLKVDYQPMDPVVVGEVKQ